MGAKTSKETEQDAEQTKNLDCVEASNILAVEASIDKRGVYYYVQLSPRKEMKKPPKLSSSSHQSVRSSLENLQEMADDLEEKMLIANILREENLRAKGRAAREFSERQAKVLQRKTRICEDKIQRVQEKMYLDDVRLLNRPRLTRPKIRLSYKPHQSRSEEHGNRTGLMY